MKLEVYNDLIGGKRVYKLEIDKEEMMRAKLTSFDHALFDDIEKGKPSDTPLADILLGMETLVRRIEEATPKDGVKE